MRYWQKLLPTNFIMILLVGTWYSFSVSTSKVCNRQKTCVALQKEGCVGNGWQKQHIVKQSPVCMHRHILQLGLNQCSQPQTRAAFNLPILPTSQLIRQIVKCNIGYHRQQKAVYHWWQLCLPYLPIAYTIIAQTLASLSATVATLLYQAAHLRRARGLRSHHPSPCMSLHECMQAAC